MQFVVTSVLVCSRLFTSAGILPRAAPEMAIHHVHLVLSLSYCFERPPSFTCADPSAMSRFVQKLKKKTGRLLADKSSSSPLASSPPLVVLNSDPISSTISASDHAYAAPQTPLTVGKTVGSAIYELLAAARDGSDLCLPLKAALVGVVKIWDICQVCNARDILVSNLTGPVQRTAEVKDEYEKLESRLAHLNAVSSAYGKRNHINPSLKQRLDSIAMCVNIFCRFSGDRCNFLRFSSFERLAVCIEAKLERGTAKRVFQSNEDIAEIKDLLGKISARIEAFLVSVKL